MYLLHYHYIKDKLRHRTNWSIRLDSIRINIKSIEYIRAKSIFEFTHILARHRCRNTMVNISKALDLVPLKKDRNASRQALKNHPDIITSSPSNFNSNSLTPLTGAMLSLYYVSHIQAMI